MAYAESFHSNIAILTPFYEKNRKNLHALPRFDYLQLFQNDTSIAKENTDKV